MEKLNKKSIFISATDTDVGKTFISAGIVYILLSLGYKTAYFKPVQSGSGSYEESDMHFVDRICKGHEGYSSHNCYMLSEPVSPHLAAEIDGVNINETTILKKYIELEKENDFVLVEGAGGLAVPIIRGQLWIYDLIRILDISTILVSDMRVGAINQTLSAAAFARDKQLDVSGVILNSSQESMVHLDNLRIIRENVADVPSNQINNVYRCDNNDEESIRNYYLGKIFKYKILEMLK